jgi:hypothetical protein
MAVIGQPEYYYGEDGRRHPSSGGCNVKDDTGVSLARIVPAVSFATLPDQILAQTTGVGGDGIVNLDMDAAGYGWFVDLTPDNNEEFLATADPNVWLAKPGSAAEGKMDMLSVLQHEYGHVLGLDHSADNHDAMGATLKPGERRLWTAEERVLISQLSAKLQAQDTSAESQQPGLPLAPFAPLTSTGLLAGLGITARRRPSSPQALGANNLNAANASLTNGTLSNEQGWTHNGAVGFGASGARLGERADAQAALRQVFTVSDKDHYLRFTVAGDLHGQSDGPSDAFEAALLDANTGAALRAISGLSHSDALLNIQGSKTSGAHFGQSRNATGVAVRENADGSRTYTVDLAGIPAQTAVELSFDLIGFGEADSAMLVSDVKLLSDLPPESALQPNADVVTTAEDTPVTIEVKANDRVPTGASVEVTLAAAPQHGSVTLNADGSFAYTPEANWFGDDSFTYTLKAGNEVSEAARVSLSVTPVNDAPVLAPSSLATPMGSPLAIKLSETAQDVEGDTLSVTLVSQPTHGTLVKNADGSYRYTPEASFKGTDSFRYKVSDGQAESEVATLTITVGEGETIKIRDLSLAGQEDVALSIDLRDQLGAGQAVEILSQPAHGTLTRQAEGQYSYLGASNWAGADSFTWRITGATGASDLATVKLDLAAVNDAPTLASLSLSTAEDVALNINLAANASDVDGDSLRVLIVSQPEHGELVKNEDGTHRYMPMANFNGTDRFSYTVSDGTVESEVLTVEVTVTPVNDAPTLSERGLSTEEDRPLEINLLANASDAEGDALRAVIVSAPAHGELVKNADGTVRYTPAANFNGEDRFSYKVTDGTAESEVMTVVIAVTAVNDVPVLGALSLVTAEDTALAINLASNASDVDGDSLRVLVVSQPAHGELVKNEDGTHRYMPVANFHGTDRFSYKVSDGTVESEVLTVDVTVTPVNDVPTLSERRLSTAEDNALVIDLLANARDAEGDALRVNIVGSPTHGELVREADGRYRYTPAANFNGEDSIRYTVSDGVGSSEVFTLAMDVTAVNDAPTLGALSLITREDDPLNINLVANASDVDGDSLRVLIVSQPEHGELIKNEDGTHRYIPVANFNGTDRFSYQVTDGTVASATLVVEVSVTAQNDVPVAYDGALVTHEDGSVVIDFRAYGSDADGAAPQVDVVASPAHGVLSKNADGTYTYAPAPDFYGADELRFRFSDGELVSNEASLKIAVVPVNDAPVLSGRSVSTPEDNALDMDLLSTASDVDGRLPSFKIVSGLVLDFVEVVETEGVLTAIIVSPPTHGTLTRNPNGSYRYTPAANYAGPDSFTYKVSDGELESNVVTVQIDVTPVNDAPTLVALADQTLDEGVPLRVKLDAADVDGDALSYRLDSAPAGAYIDTATKELVWLNPDGPGEQRVSVTVSDPSGATATQGFTLTVRDVPPVLRVTGEPTAKAGSAYVLNLAATSVGNDAISEWVVDWGDGTVETLTQSPTRAQHTYLAPGAYAIRASAKDQDGRYAAAALPLQVLPAGDIELRTQALSLLPGATLGDNNAGLPVILDSLYPLKAISFMLRYDATLMKVSSVVAGANLPADAQIDAVVHEPGFVRVTINCRSKNLAVGQALELVKLKGTVLATATRGKVSALDLTLNSVVGLMGESYVDKLAAIDGVLMVGGL